MNKRNKVIILISLVLIVLFVLYYFFNKQIKSIIAPKTKTETKIEYDTNIFITDKNLISTDF